MDLKKLAADFYHDNPRVEQALDFDSATNTWQTGKTRGHGIVKVTVNGLIFAIPVRSHIHHNASYIIEVNRNVVGIKGMGLDYSKALLIRSANHVSNDVFLLKSKSAGKKLIGKQAHVEQQFEAYVNKYIKAVTTKDRNIINSNEYRFTTLINYHTELGL